MVGCGLRAHVLSIWTQVHVLRIADTLPPHPLRQTQAGRASALHTQRRRAPRCRAHSFGPETVLWQHLAATAACLWVFAPACSTDCGKKLLALCATVPVCLVTRQYPAHARPSCRHHRTCPHPPHVLSTTERHKPALRLLADSPLTPLRPPIPDRIRQVRVRRRVDCRPLPEQVWGPIIADNYYSCVAPLIVLSIPSSPIPLVAASHLLLIVRTNNAVLSFLLLTFPRPIRDIESSITGRGTFTSS